MKRKKKFKLFIEWKIIPFIKKKIVFYFMLIKYIWLYMINMIIIL